MLSKQPFADKTLPHFTEGFDGKDRMQLGLELFADSVCAEQRGVTGLCKLKKFKRWTFNKYSGKCEKFLYAKCGVGNGNNFKSKRKCKRKCGKGMQNH